MNELDIVKFEAIEDELVGEYCIQPFTIDEASKIFYYLCEKYIRHMVML